MTAPDMTRIRQDHGLAQARWETNNLPTARQHYGVSWRQGARNGWWAGIEYVLTLQHGWDGLPQDEAIRELGKGEGSIYSPLFSADPRFWGNCGRCHHRILITAEGICPDCGHELV